MLDDDVGKDQQLLVVTSNYSELSQIQTMLAY